MKTWIVRIGNSRGIRIPKQLLEETGLSGVVDIRAEASGLVIRPVTKPRAGWAAAFQKMTERGDDGLNDATPSLSDWDTDDWNWLFEMQNVPFWLASSPVGRKS